MMYNIVCLAHSLNTIHKGIINLTLSGENITTKQKTD